MNRGIVVLALGKEYDKVAAHTIAHARMHTPLPITIITNIPEAERHEKWKSVPEIDFLELKCSDDDSRSVRTRLINHTPYDETLSVDCDAVMQKPGIEAIFERLADVDAVFQQCHEWTPEKRYYKLYRDAAKLFHIELPWKIFNGGFFAFKKNDAARNFFAHWNEYWCLHGVGRDMPAMAAAIRNSCIKHAIITREKDKFFSFGMRSDAIILHRVKFDDLNRYFGIPRHEHNKKYDDGNAWFWEMAYFRDEDNELVNDPWIKKKFGREFRITQKRRHIEVYLPEMLCGGLDVLDVATGPGEFLELALEMGCHPLGIEGLTRMLDRPIDILYNRYSKLRIAENHLPVIFADMNDVLLKDMEGLVGKKFDIINCQLAINFIFSEHFDHHPELGEYKNNGEWKFSQELDLCFLAYLSWCKEHLKGGGIVVIAALQALNKAEYSKRIIATAESLGFVCEKTQNELDHRFRLKNG